MGTRADARDTCYLRGSPQPNVSLWVRGTGAFPYHGTLFSHERARQTDPCYSRGRASRTCRVREARHGTNTVWFHLQELWGGGKSVETGNAFVGAGGGPWAFSV